MKCILKKLDDMKKELKGLKETLDPEALVYDCLLEWHKFLEEFLPVLKESLETIEKFNKQKQDSRYLHSSKGISKDKI